MSSSSSLLVCILTVRLKLGIYPQSRHASRENSARPAYRLSFGVISTSQLSHTAGGGLMMAYAGTILNVYAMRKYNRRPVGGRVRETGDLTFETDTSDASEASDDDFSFFSRLSG